MAEPSQPVAVTFDVDPDANRAVPGRADAVSPPVENGEACTESSVEGFDRLCQMLGDAGVPATFFFEGRTLLAYRDAGLDVAALVGEGEAACHSMRHEDFLGIDSGVPMSRREKRDAIRQARHAIEDVLGVSPSGFRAPYTRIDDDLLDVLREQGFRYDSSRTVRLDRGESLAPSDAGGIIELPMPAIRDEGGKRMTSYLWPMFEGKREPSEYVRAVLRLGDRIRDGVFVIALHPWHLVVDEDGNRFGLAERERNELAFRSLVDELRTRDDLRPVTLQAYLSEWAGPSVR